ncbi:MAG: class I SAM-dependent DNA methyltransferase [Candidatus Thorarchaeota archaeon]
MINSKRIDLKDLHDIEEKIEKLGIFLSNQEFQKTDHYKLWYKDFSRIYGQNFTNLRLYVLSAILYFMGYLFIVKIIRDKSKEFDYENININSLKEMPIEIERNYPNLGKFTIGYYNLFLTLFPKQLLKSLTEIFHYLLNSMLSSNLNPEYFFDYLVQNFLSPLIRHKSGEFYTPPFLVKKMVNFSYKFGEKVLDPSCGSGNFLIEIIKKILTTNKAREEKLKAINNIYGYDINPLTIFFAKLTFLYLLSGEFSKFDINLYVFDSLFQNDKNLQNKFDLVIGNPPWYTLRDIDSLEIQNKVKKLAEELEIKPTPKNVLNIEISALFFYKVKDYFMKKKAKIFFIITKGVISGSHASRFRSFKGFSEIRIWLFSKNIEKIFNIDFICLYARKSENPEFISKFEIPAHQFSLKTSTESLNYFNDIELIQENSKTLVPYSIEKKSGKILIKKLISQEDKTNLLPINASYYKNLFHKGADLNPRNLIFVTYENQNNDLVKINTDPRVFKRAKSPWNKKEFENELIEKKYIFKVVKSTELVKFLIYDHYYVFLPLEKKSLDFNISTLGKYAKKFYDMINKIYLNNKKSTTKNNSLMENLDRWSKLRNPRQLSNIKVVYNNSGSIMNAAVIEGNFLVTGDLSFFNTDDLDEAYYLSAILNSSLMNKQIRIKKSSRHIFKIPFETPIKKYDASLKNHRELVELAKKGHYIARETVENLKKKQDTFPSKIIIQKMIKTNLKQILKLIDNSLKKEFSNLDNSEIIY